MISLPILLAAAQVLTLAQAESNTRQNLPAIHLAIAQTLAQKADRDIAYSYYLPQLSASGSVYPFGVSSQGNLAGQGGTFNGSNLNATVISQQGSLGLVAEQLVYDFHQTSDKIRQNDVLITAQKDNEAVVWNGVVMTTRVAYFNCQQDLELIRVAQENLDDQNKHVDEMTVFVQQGTHTAVDLAQAKQQAAAAMYQLIQAKGNYLVAKAALQQAMGIDAPPDYEVNTDPFPAVSGEDFTTDALLPEAVAARPEMKNFADQIEAQRFAISWNRNSWLPVVNAYLGGSGIFSATDGEHGSASVTPSAKVGLLANWQFWQGGIAPAQGRQAEAVLSQLQAQLDAQKQQVRNDVDNGRIAIATAKGQLESAQEALTYAKEQLRLAEGQYEAGVGIALAVFDAQVAVFTAGGQVAQSVDALATGRAQLIRALGREKY